MMIPQCTTRIWKRKPMNTWAVRRGETRLAVLPPAQQRWKRPTLVRRFQRIS